MSSAAKSALNTIISLYNASYFRMDKFLQHLLDFQECKEINQPMEEFITSDRREEILDFYYDNDLVNYCSF